MNGFEGLVKCSKCGEEFTISSQNVFKKKVVVNAAAGVKVGRTIWVTYYDCPKCCERYVVQIDDEKTNALLDSQIKLIGRILHNKRVGKDVSRKQANKYNRISSDLTKLRMFLSKAFDGMQAVDPDSGEVFTIAFCVSGSSYGEGSYGDNPTLFLGC